MSSVITLPSDAALERRLIRSGGLARFIRAAWPHVVSRPLLWNWHHDIICDALERLDRREIRKLCIMIPPGCTKTLIAFVFRPAWIWTHSPTRKFIVGTYGASLTLNSARKHRDLVNSAWYRERWPKCTIPYQNTHAAAWFVNSHRGFRFSGMVGGDVTGRHADDLGGDDLNKVQDAIGSAAEVQTVLDTSWRYWTEVLPSRQDNPLTTTWLLIGQRIHVADVPGRWVASDPDVEVICIPMRGAPDHPLRHRLDNRAEGELLWPARWDERAVVNLERMLGPTQAAAQLQQDPIPPGGRLLRDDYFAHRYEQLPGPLRAALETLTPGSGQTWRIYGDMTFKGKATADWVVIQLWCRHEGRAYLIDQVRGKWGFVESRRQLRDFAGRYRLASEVKLEDAANAAGLEDDLRHDCPVPVTTVPVAGGCLARMQRAEGHWAAGDVVLPANATWMGGSDGFVAEHLGYDGSGRRHDDQVACSGLAIVDLLCAGASSWSERWGAVLAPGGR